MRRADRLFQIIQYLQGRRLVTARQLAERLEVSERTIYRDIRDLMLSGVPIEGEAGVGYVLRRGFHLPPLMFTPDEMEALVVGARLVRAWGGSGLAGAAEEALVKIDSVLPAGLRAHQRDIRLYAMRYEHEQAVRDQLDVIRAAIHARRKLMLDYTRADGERRARLVWPLGVFFWGAVWTLAAWCELRGDYRNFRLDRINGMEQSPECFRETGDISLRAYLAQYETDAISLNE